MLIKFLILSCALVRNNSFAACGFFVRRITKKGTTASFRFQFNKAFVLHLFSRSNHIEREHQESEQSKKLQLKIELLHIDILVPLLVLSTIKNM